MGPPPSPILGYLIVPMGSSLAEKAAKALAWPVKCPAGYVKVLGYLVEPGGIEPPTS